MSIVLSRFIRKWKQRLLTEDMELVTLLTGRGWEMDRQGLVRINLV